MPPRNLRKDAGMNKRPPEKLPEPWLFAICPLKSHLISSSCGAARPALGRNIEYEITILSVEDSKQPNTMSVLRTKMRDLVQAASIPPERAEHLRQHVGETMSLDEFFDLLIEPIL
jgi:hypothetical protein